MFVTFWERLRKCFFVSLGLSNSLLFEEIFYFESWVKVGNVILQSTSLRRHSDLQLGMLETVAKHRCGGYRAGRGGWGMGPGRGVRGQGVRGGVPTYLRMMLQCIMGIFCNALWDRYPPPPPPVNRQTENITFARSCWAGGKYYFY